MPLAGEQLTFKEALALCNVVGFDPNQLDVAVAVMCGESGRYTEAWHDNLDAEGNVLSTDRGLFQINSKNEMSGDPFDPVRNAAKAFEMSEEGTDWHLWMAFDSGAYEKFLIAVKEVRTTTDWRSRKKLYE